MLDFYDPSQQWVGMVSLPYGQPSNKCIAYGDRRTHAAHVSGLPELHGVHAGRTAGLSSNYKTAATGPLNPASIRSCSRSTAWRARSDFV